MWSKSTYTWETGNPAVVKGIGAVVASDKVQSLGVDAGIPDRGLGRSDYPVIEGPAGIRRAEVGGVDGLSVVEQLASELKVLRLFVSQGGIVAERLVEDEQDGVFFGTALAQYREISKIGA